MVKFTPLVVDEVCRVRRNGREERVTQRGFMVAINEAHGPILAVSIARWRWPWFAIVRCCLGDRYCREEEHACADQRPQPAHVHAASFSFASSKASLRVERRCSSADWPE